MARLSDLAGAAGRGQGGPGDLRLDGVMMPERRDGSS
jgi:hypothetical protein